MPNGNLVTPRTYSDDGTLWCWDETAERTIVLTEREFERAEAIATDD